MNIEATKLELIKLIAEEHSEQLLEQVWLFFKKAAKSKALTANGKSKVVNEEDIATAPKPKKPSKQTRLISSEEFRKLANMPTPSTIDIEHLKKEQGYDSSETAEFFRRLDRSIWKDENKAELLQLLTK